MAQFYLCLDVSPANDEAAKALDLTGINDVRDALAHPALQGDGWIRRWWATPDRTKALLYQADNPTLVVIPLNAETVPLELLP